MKFTWFKFETGNLRKAKYQSPMKGARLEKVQITPPGARKASRKTYFVCITPGKEVFSIFFLS